VYGWIEAAAIRSWEVAASLNYSNDGEHVMTDDYTRQDAELRANVTAASKALDQAYNGVNTDEDFNGVHFKPTKVQRERIEAAQQHLKACITSLDAFLNCIR
jgi:uncharacterized protein (UPF0210 family)